jgi:hypothetical protein
MPRRKDPSGYVRLAARLRMTIDRLAFMQRRADELELPHSAGKIGDAMLELAYAYEELIQLASSPNPPQPRKDFPF